MLKAVMWAGAMLALAGCAGAEVTRTSDNSMMIDAAAAPSCGSLGAAKVASKVAAVETIKAGFDRYIVTGSGAQNNVSVAQAPGSFNTVGAYGRGGYRASTTYTPGPTIVSGTHDRQLGVVMFRQGQPGSENALDARQQLGPEWREIVQNGVHTCL